MYLYRVKNIENGRFLNRAGKAVFSIEGDFFKSFTTARNQRDRANPFVNSQLQILRYRVVEEEVFE